MVTYYCFQSYPKTAIAQLLAILLSSICMARLLVALATYRLRYMPACLLALYGGTVAVNLYHFFFNLLVTLKNTAPRTTSGRLFVI